MSERVIWERTIDHDRIERRRRRFVQWFWIPAAFCLVAGLLFAGWKNTIGIAIVLGIIGLLTGSWVRFSSLSDQANPTMTVGDGRIVLGRESVAITDVTSYTTLVASMQTSLFGERSRIYIGKAIFRLDERGTASTRRANSDVEFGWPNMGEDGVESIEVALDPMLPGKWIPPEDFFASDAKDQTRRAKRRRLSQQMRRLG